MGESDIVERPRRRVSAEVLAVREYLTTGEVCLIFGESGGVWASAFDRGLIDGHMSGNRRKLSRASIREYLANRAELEREDMTRRCPDPYRRFFKEARIARAARRAAGLGTTE